MEAMKRLIPVIALLITNTCHGEEIHVGSFKLVRAESNAFDYSLIANGQTVLSGKLGLSLPSSVGTATATCEPGDSDACYEWGDYARLYLTSPKGDDTDNCATVEWYSPYSRRIEDCFDLQPGVHWYGGAETRIQPWPIETVVRQEAAFVTGDFLQSVQFGGLLETYWIATSGLAVHVQEDTPLFTSWNSTNKDKFCLIAQDVEPYTSRNEVRMKYDICVPKTGENFKDVHLRAIRKYYAIPSAIPDEYMLTRPFWSTWAEYKTGINQSLVTQFARRMIAENYTINSHIEIDDNWESCYGEAEFDAVKFPDPAAMVQELAGLGIEKTTLWIHPFINFDCPSFATGFANRYFITDSKLKTRITSWWQGANSGLIDFASNSAITWWRSRLERLTQTYGITSFKFDAGEAFWLPPLPRLSSGDPKLLPNILSTKYVEAVSYFGGLIEVRTAHRNQGLPIYFRMLDKDSGWGYDNGLQSLITTLLTFSVLGYSFVMPDMIGGNAYGAFPSNELYIRWAQANVFMPAWQFSILPWDRDPTKELDRIVKASVDLRLAHADDILEAARETTRTGYPMNRPMWWVDPTDPVTFTIDDQYMLGDDILVAPVVKEGAVSRNIYLPIGTWSIQTADGEQRFVGPQWLNDWPAPLDTLPFFKRVVA